MVIVANSEAIAETLLRIFPWLPAVTGDCGSLFLGPPGVEGGGAPRRCAWEHSLTECQEDMLWAVLIAEDAESLFEMVGSLEDLAVPWVKAILV